MAEGGRRSFTASSYKGSDEVFDFTCTPCIQEGRHVEAVNFCADCAEFFCPGCTRQHNKFGMTSGHNVVSTDQADQAASLLPTERCREHKGERISTYCGEHDVVVCSTCLALDHRACRGGAYIPNITGGPGQKKDRQRVKYDISQALNAMSQVKLSIQDRQATADTERNEHLKHIKDCTETLIKHAHGLEKAAVADVGDQHKKTTKGLQSEMKSVDDVTEKMKKRLKNLNNTLVTNDSQTFVDIKQGEKEVQDAKQLEERSKSSGSGQGKATFVVDDSVDTFLNVNYLGKVIRTKPYKAVLKGQYNVELKEEEYNCNITDICLLSDGKILMTDYANNCIKMLDTSNKVSKCFQMPSRTWGICQTSQDEVAVTLTEDRKVQFVNNYITGKWRLTRSFKVEDRCRGITRSNDQLLVSCGGYPGDRGYTPEGPGFVGVHDIWGTILRKIQFDSQERQIFSVPSHITTTCEGRKIHIADKKGGVITVDRRGKVLSRFSKNLIRTHALCAVSDVSLIVGDYESNNVLQIDDSGTIVAELLSSKDGMGKPCSLSYVRSSSRLIVAFENSDVIKIFDIVV